MITRTTRRTPVTRRSPITANTSITSGIQNRQARPAMNMRGLSPEQQAFARQIQNNMRRSAVTPITAATNTTNIMARPDFIELLPMFVQKLHILDVYGSIAMRSRSQIIPYFKFIAENTKGETKAGTVLSSPFANRQGVDPNFTGRVVKNELIGESVSEGNLVYTPVLPNSVTIKYTDSESGETKTYTDNGDGCLYDGTEAKGYIDYSTGALKVDDSLDNGNVVATYQYDNENVGPRDENGYGHEYGAQMAKGYLQLDEINLVAEAHQLACYWSVYSAFAAQTEYGSNVGDIAKDAAFSELTAEINTLGFNELLKAASYQPQFNWDASPVLTGSVVPSDYLNMFKLKLNQAAASIYRKTRLAQPNRLVVGSNVASYVSMINSFQAEPLTDNVGPYKLGSLDQFEIYVNPDFNPDTWVMACKSSDIRRNSALFGEYMPITNTDPISLGNASAQQGYATMYALKVVNPDTVVSGKIIGTF